MDASYLPAIASSRFFAGGRDMQEEDLSAFMGSMKVIHQFFDASTNFHIGVCPGMVCADA